jgi:hypothetical protein
MSNSHDIPIESQKFDRTNFKSVCYFNLVVLGLFQNHSTDDIYHWKSIILSINDWIKPGIKNELLLRALRSFAVNWTMVDLEEEDYTWMKETYLKLYEFGIDADIEFISFGDQIKEMEEILLIGKNKSHFFVQCLENSDNNNIHGKTSIVFEDMSEQDIQYLRDQFTTYSESSNNKKIQIKCFGNESNSYFEEHVYELLVNDEEGKMDLRQVFLDIIGVPNCMQNKIPKLPKINLRYEVDIVGDEKKFNYIVQLPLLPCENQSDLFYYDPDTCALTIIISERKNRQEEVKQHT